MIFIIKKLEYTDKHKNKNPCNSNSYTQYCIILVCSILEFILCKNNFSLQKQNYSVPVLEPAIFT